VVWAGEAFVEEVLVEGLVVPAVEFGVVAAA